MRQRRTWPRAWALPARVGLCALLTLGACAGADVGAEDDGEGLASNKGDDDLLVFSSDGTPPELGGSYRFELVSEVTTVDEGGLFTEPTETTSTTRLHGVVETAQDGTAVTFYLALCGIQLPEVAGYQPMVDQETVRRLPAVTSQGMLYDAEGVARFSTDPSAWVVGAALEDSLNDPMPEDDADLRVVDVEMDGHPGITMTLEGWDIYGAMRLLFQLHGALGEGGGLAGDAQVAMDTKVYGDTVPLINVAKKIEAMQDETTVIAERHVFSMTPMAGSNLTCEQAFDGAPITTTEGAIGASCGDDGACTNAGGLCLTSAQGMPDGHCSAPCDDGACEGAEESAVCADADAIGVAAEGSWCLARCDAGGTPCRAGYRCASVEVGAGAGSFSYGCIPDQGPPPETTDCLTALDERGIGYELASNAMESPEGHPELVCDVKDPVLVDGTLAGVSFRYADPNGEVNRIYAACELALAMHDTAQIAAAQGVTDIVHLGVYNCRVKTGSNTLSQHAHANAIDIAGMVFDNGAYWTIFDDWEDGVLDPVTAAGDWLSWFANELYLKWIFNVVLTPEYDDHHDDHLHCDLTPGEHTLH